MPSVSTEQSPPLATPRAARAAIVLAFVLAFIFGLSVRSGPIMLVGVSLTALYSAVSMLRGRVWGAYGFGSLLLLSTLVVLFFALTGQNSGGFLRVSIATFVYLGISALFFLSGHSLAVAGAKRGSPIPWILIALCFSLPFLLFRPITVSTNSMAATLLTGDFVLANRFDHQLANGKLIAFRYPLDGAQTFIRRIAGVPGDHIHFAGAKLVRNGAVIPEPYVTREQAKRVESFDNFPVNMDTQALQSAGREMLRHNVMNGEIVVPAHKVFVLGDARDTSFDSRNWGFVDESEIVGTPRLIYDSLTQGSAAANAAGGGFAPAHRWDRMFKAL